MKTSEFITTINGTDIYAAITEEGKVLIPVKPICQALGVASSPQIRALKSDPILSTVVTPGVTTGSDGKCYEMVCLPVEYVFGRLFTISPAYVGESARATLIAYQRECYDVLFTHFYGRVKLMDEMTQREADLLARKRELTVDITRLKSGLRDIDKQLDSLSQARTDLQNSLFSSI